MDDPQNAVLKRQKERLAEVKKRRLLMESEINHIQNRQHEAEERMLRKSAEILDSRDRVLEKLGHVPKLQQESLRTYGSRANNHIRNAYAASPDSSKAPALDVMGDIMKTRNLAHREDNKHRSQYIRQLNEEKKRLVEQRDLLLKKKSQLRPDRLTPVSPTPSSRLSPISPRFIPSRESTQSVLSDRAYAHETHAHIPFLQKKVTRLREEYQAEWNRRKKPYNSELGIHTYRPDQMNTYYLCRSLVDETVDRFLNLYFRKDEGIYQPEMRSPTPSVDSEGDSISSRGSGATSAAISPTASPHSSHHTRVSRIRNIRAQNERQLGQARRTLQISQAINLIIEDIILEGTSELAEDTAYEYMHLQDYSLYRTLGSFYNLIEGKVTGKGIAREQNEAKYDSVTNYFKAVVRNRDEKKTDIWSHSQPVGTQDTEQLRILNKPEDAEAVNSKCVIS